MVDMVEYKTWEEFRKIGLLWWVNRILHTFGWAITFNPEDGTATPARVKFRGFDIDSESEGFQKMQENFTQKKWHDEI